MPLHSAHGEAREVVVPGPVHARHLRRLAADERAPGLLAALCDGGDDGRARVHAQLARCKVVEEEQGLRALHHQVVHHHGHEVDADVVVEARGLGDHELGPHAVRARAQERVVRVARRLRIEEAAEAADGAEAAGALGARARGLDALHQRVARVDVHARRAVGDGARALRRRAGRGGVLVPVHRGGRGQHLLGALELAHRGDEGLALEGLHARLEGLGRVPGQHVHRLLHHDLPGVHRLVDEVDRAARDACARVEHRLVHGEVHASGELGEEGGVHVEDAPVPALHEPGAEDAHPADGEDHLRARALDERRELAVVSLTRLLLARGRHAGVAQAVERRAGEDGRLGLVGHHQLHAGVEVARGDGLENRLQRRTPR
mmetsp:Transcript_14472/g.42528  ORF Transcript_14472/g.42528 Transcript_14472/m.42528 type:complete len:375 (+) Transcript_14472:635-1759(+)